ncbi:hypothetical protein J6X13_01990 [Candidatus Saccharibacteria bacterium]|nr:hypothetical protein [Candidatus Saccharibacteria bacterium]
MSKKKKNCPKEIVAVIDSPQYHVKNYERRPCLIKAVDLIGRIIRRCFNEVLSQYPDYDIYGDIEICINGGELLDELECVGRVSRHYEETNGYGHGSIYPYGRRVSIYFPVGKQVKAISLNIRFANENDYYGKPVEFCRVLEERIIQDVIKSMPSGTKYYDRLSRKAKRKIAHSAIMHHSPIKFETDIEASLYGQRYGFVDYSDQQIFKKALAVARADGYYV